MTLETSQLDVDKVLNLLDEEGPISRRLKNFETRIEQKKMLAELVDAFNSRAIALIEAGTGTGKSMAYLIPALLVAAIWKERVVISTHTISLQEQLLYKDLPLLIEALNLDVKAVLVKGMGNYVCLKKFDDIEFEKRLLPPLEQDALSRIESLALDQNMGSRSDLPFNPAFNIWEMVSAEFDTCTGNECPHYQNCFYIQARKQAQDAQILIVNHHLLFADLAVRAETQNYNSPAILPNFSHLIIDEAHNLEDIATEYFASRISRLELLKTLSKLNSEKQGKVHGKLPLLKEKVHKHLTGDFSRTTSNLLNRLMIDLPTLRGDLLKELADTFSFLEKFQERYQSESLEKDKLDENKLRLRPHHYASNTWQEEVLPRAKRLEDYLNRYALECVRLEEAIKELEEDRIYESVKNIFFDIKALAKRLTLASERIKSFIETPPDSNSIRWMETTFNKNHINLTCIDAALNISELLMKYLFNPLETVALLSATLTTQKSFQFIRKRLGLVEPALNGRKLIEATFDSPFDYEKQALLVIPEDMPAPNQSLFNSKSIELIWEAVQASRGNAFILFTSYGMLKTCYEALEEKLKSHHFFPLKQGTENRHALLKKFTEQDRSILFGTDSFWEGVDVVGEALRLVVITKLPFRVPTDPLVQARSEACTLEGKDPFYELQLPQAAIKLKQGFGRLIRNKKDRGCILCFDNRLITKAYGNYFLKTLPPCPRAVVKTQAVKSTLEDFYRNRRR